MADSSLLFVHAWFRIRVGSGPSRFLDQECFPQHARPTPATARPKVTPSAVRRIKHQSATTWSSPSERLRSSLEHRQKRHVRLGNYAWWSIAHSPHPFHYTIRSQVLNLPAVRNIQTTLLASAPLRKLGPRTAHGWNRRWFPLLQVYCARTCQRKLDPSCPTRGHSHRRHHQTATYRQPAHHRWKLAGSRRPARLGTHRGVSSLPSIQPVQRIIGSAWIRVGSGWDGTTIRIGDHMHYNLGLRA